MKILGLITEYNPFHNGHLYHLHESKRVSGCDCVIAVMSGSFVQRGEPAVFNKWLRTEMALVNGVDMVLELPAYFSASSAEFFAEAAVKLLDATGVIDCACFGSEDGCLSRLAAASGILSEESGAFKSSLRKYMAEGLSYPRSRSLAAADAGFPDLPDSPNNVLAVEYLKALQKTKSAIEPLTIKRQSGYLPASSVRKAIHKNDTASVIEAVPENVCKIIQRGLREYVPAHLDAYSAVFQYIVKTSSAEDMRRILDVGEGLENRITKCSDDNCNLTDILAAVKTKRYTYTRLARVALHMLLRIYSEDFFELMSSPIPYLRVLGFRKQSECLLKLLEDNSDVPIITNIKRGIAAAEKSGGKENALALKLLKKEVEATDIYFLAAKGAMEKYHEYRMPVVVI